MLEWNTIHRDITSDELYFVTYTIIQSIMRSKMCSLHLTHPSAHTWSSGQPTVRRPGKYWWVSTSAPQHLRWVLMGSLIHFCESALSGSFQWTDSWVLNSSSYCNSEIASKIAYTVKNKTLRKLQSLRQAASADFWVLNLFFRRFLSSQFLLYKLKITSWENSKNLL